MGNLYWRQCLLMEKNIHDIAVFLDSNLNFTIKLFTCGLANDNMSIKKKNLQIISQGCREGTSIVAFEVLIINCQIYFINLFIFNCFNIKRKIVHLQVVQRQIFVFRKSCLSQTEEKGCLWSCGCASLVSDFKITRENDDLLSWRHK